MKCNQILVDLKKIDHTDTMFIVTSGRNYDNIMLSMKETGFSTPPCLVLSGTRYRIVSGYLRVRALAGLGKTEVMANVFDPDTDERDLFLFAFYDNLAHRDFNIIEKANIVERLLKYFDSDEVIKKYLPLLGFNPSGKILDNIVCIINLEEELKEAVLRGLLTEKNSIRLSYFTKQARLKLFKLFCCVNLSSSKQAEIMEGCRDIAIRDNVLVTEIIDDGAIEQILAADEYTLSQKGDRIRQFIKERRFPRLIQKQKDFQLLKKKLQLPLHVDIEPPPFFEGDVYKIEISFRTVDELESAVSVVKRIGVNVDIKKKLRG